MPVTPAHAALALPLSRAAPALPLAALVIGTLSPDFEYLVRLSPTGRFAHSPVGLVAFCVPVALLAWGLWCAVVRPALVSLLPPGMALATSRGASGAGRSPMALAGLGAVAAFLGALSHVFWDAFTHADGWAVAHLPALGGEATVVWPLGVRRYKVLQYVSSAAGMAVLAAWGVQWVVRFPPRDRLFAPGQAGRSAGVVLALLGVAAGAGVLNALRAPSGRLAAALGFAIVGAMAGLVAAALAYALLARARSA
jgi:Domain of unknown function (DUF4184)